MIDMEYLRRLPIPPPGTKERLMWDIIKFIEEVTRRKLNDWQITTLEVLVNKYRNYN